MEELKRLAINFDLDTNKMREASVYPSGYGKINQSMKKNGFEHRQGSGYVSKEKMFDFDIVPIVKRVTEDNSWLASCVKRLDVTEVGNNFDMTNVIRGIPNAVTPTSAPVQEDEMDM